MNARSDRQEGGVESGGIGEGGWMFYYLVDVWNTSGLFVDGFDPAF